VISVCAGLFVPLLTTSSEVVVQTTTLVVRTTSQHIVAGDESPDKLRPLIQGYKTKYEYQVTQIGVQNPVQWCIAYLRQINVTFSVENPTGSDAREVLARILYSYGTGTGAVQYSFDFPIDVIRSGETRQFQTPEHEPSDVHVACQVDRFTNVPHLLLDERVDLEIVTYIMVIVTSVTETTSTKSTTQATLPLAAIVGTGNTMIALLVVSILALGVYVIDRRRVRGETRVY